MLHVLEFSALRGQIVEVDAFFISNEPQLRQRNLDAGLQFGSPLIEHHDDFNAGYVQHLTNREALAQVIAFDTFICNKDRSAGNLLISLSDPKQKNKDCEVLLIDHTEAGRGGNWNEGSLKALSTDENIYIDVVNFNHVSPEMDAFESALLRLEALTPDIIDEIIRSVPSEWRLSIGDAQALTEFLVERKGKVRPIIARHLKA